MLHYSNGTPKVLYLVSNVQLVKCFLLLNEWLIQCYLSLLWQEFTMYFTTKAKPINNVDSKYHNYIETESNITCLNGSMVFNSLGADTHTLTCTHQLPKQKHF